MNIKAIGDFSVLKKILFGLITIYSAISWANLVSDSSVNVANSITGFVLVIVAGIAVLALFYYKKDRIWITSIIIGLILSAAIVLGRNIENSWGVRDIAALGNAGLDSLTTYLMILGLIPICGGYLLLIYRYLCLKINTSQDKLDINQIDNNHFFFFNKRFSTLAIVFLCAIVIFVCWLPVLLAMYPGINGYDSAYQIKQFYSGNLDSHHPILHTLFLGLCVSLGQLLSSNELGILFYSIIQMAIMAGIFGLACRCVLVLTRSKVLFSLSLIWFAFCPLNSVFSISVTKDVLFCGFVILSICLFIMMLENNKRNSVLTIGLIISLSLVLLFRNNAVIAYGLLLIIFGIWIVKKKTFCMKLCIVAISPVLIFLVITGPVYSSCGITNSSAIKASLSVPIQQLARTANLSNDLSDSERQMIDVLIPAWDQYQAGISDRVKVSFDAEYFKNNIWHVGLNYLSIGLSHMQIYTDSFLVNTYGYWYPDTTAMSRGDFAYHPYFETPQNMEDLDESYFHVDHENRISVIGSIIEEIDNSYIWEKVPGIALLLNSGMIIWLYIITLGFFIAIKDRSNYIFIVPITFLILYWGTCVLGPCLLVRYIYPLFAGLPILVAFICSKRQELVFNANRIFEGAN